MVGWLVEVIVYVWEDWILKEENNELQRWTVQYSTLYSRTKQERETNNLLYWQREIIILYALRIQASNLRKILKINKVQKRQIHKNRSYCFDL